MANFLGRMGEGAEQAGERKNGLEGPALPTQPRDTAKKTLP